MTYQTELQTYADTLGETVDNIGTLGAKLGDFSTALNYAKNAVESVDKIGDLAEKASKAIDVQLTTLKLTKQAGPLKTPSKIFEKVLKLIEPVAEKIDKAVDKLNGKKDSTGDGTEEKGEFLEDLAEQLEKASEAIADVALELESQARELNKTRETTLEFMDALDHATFAEYDALKTEIEGQINGRNLVTEPLGDAFNGVLSSVNNVLGIVAKAEFELVNKDISGFDDVSALLTRISEPLTAVAAIIKPIEWLLDAVGFVVDLVLGPIFDFITKTLGIDKLLKGIANDIKELLPDADFLEPMLAEVQNLIDSMHDFNDSAFGINDLQLDIDARIYGATVGNALLGPTGIGDDSSETLQGDSGDDLLDARGGDDIVMGGDGNDVIIAGEGNDRVFGGNGTDMVYFGGFFNEYELAIDSDGKIIVTHVRPAPGTQNEGSTRLDSIEHVVFANIAFTGAELENAIIGGSVLNGTSGDDLLFLNSSGTPNTDGQHVVNGLDGDDRIFGSTGDDELNGGNGNDILLPGLGDDEANGGAGSDSYQVLDSGSNSAFRIDLEAGTVVGNEGRDTLNSVENLIIQGNGNHFIAGSSADNNLLSAGGDDVVGGRDGDDFFNTGQGYDVIVTGAGKDRVQSGDDSDFILATSLTVAGEDEFFDGGRGRDVLSYSRSLEGGFSMEPNAQGEVKKLLAELNGSTGSVRINAATGIIEKLDAGGNVISTDTAVNIESFIGSDFDDVIAGGPGTYEHYISISGAGGNDTLLSRGAKNVSGGEGDDLLVLELVDSSLIETIFTGDAGHDILDLRQVDDVRWRLDWTGSSAGSVKAFEGDFIGSLRGTANTRGSLSIASIEEVFFGDGAHLIENDAGGGVVRTFHTGKGDDQLFTRGGTAIFDAGDGDDYAELLGHAVVYGGRGDDRMVFDNTSHDQVGQGGNGNDWITLRRFDESSASGGKGFDTLVFDTQDFAMTVDLKAGTAIDTGAGSFPNIDAQIQGFERVIGSEFSDSISGRKANETLIGREGNDMLDGRQGNDQLFGGAGNDTLIGGANDDRLHGGAGINILMGGKGRDTAVYSYAAPDGLEAILTAGNFGGVVVDLTSGVASGSFGSDTLFGIEDVVGSAGNDRLTGDGKRNVLSGGAGDDILNGMGGNDVLVLGSGTDTALGGDGNDLIIVGVGGNIVNGGNGNDRMEFGPDSGQVTVNFQTKSFYGTLNVLRPIWQDTGTTEARLFNGMMITPQQVKETQAIYAKSGDDLTRVLPDTDDPLFNLLRITEKPGAMSTTGNFESIETVVGGNAAVHILLSTGIDRYDGTRSDKDVLDFSANTSGISYNIATGATDFDLAMGDNLKGIDRVLGGSGDDRFTGDNADNWLIGDGGNDTLVGAGGNDRLLGGGRRDTLSGGDGDDTLKGGSGRDALNGGDGEDKLIGGLGNDRLTGGNGADTFVFGPNGARDVILDFEDDIDHLDLRDFGFSTAAQALAKATEIKGDTHFDFGDGDIVVVKDITKSELSDDILV